MSSITKTRILLKLKNNLKRFFYILPLEDGTICFGSSFPKPQEARIGTIRIPEGIRGTARVSFSEANPVSTSPGKFSYHPQGGYPSAIIHYRNSDEEELIRYDVSELGRMGDYRKILIVRPHSPALFRGFDKQPEEHDIVFPLERFQGKPFAVYVYLVNKNYDCRPLMTAGATNLIGVCENRDYRLVLVLFQKHSFGGWPRLTTFIPYVDGVNLEL